MKKMKKFNLSYIMVFLVAICLTLVPVQVKAATTDNITSVAPEVNNGVMKVTGTTGADVVAVLVEIFDKDNNLLTMETHKAADGKYEATIDVTLTEGATYLFYVANFNGKGEAASVEYLVPKKAEDKPSTDQDTESETKPETKPETGTDSKADTDIKPLEKSTLAVGSVIISGTDSSTSLKDIKGILPAITKLESQKVTNQTVIDQVTRLVNTTVQNTSAANKEVMGIVVYELNLFDGSTALHQLADKVEVSINVPFTLAANEEILVYRVDGEKLIPCTSKISDGKLVFETDHFSTFVFVKVQSSASASTTPTGDQAPIPQLLLILLTGIIVAGIAIIGYKKAQNV